MNNGIISEVAELAALRHQIRTQGSKRQHGYSGGKITAIRGRGMEFADIRAYQSGDEVRHMHWRVTARTGKAHVKIFEEERERPVFIIVDFSASMYFGTRQAFKSVVAARLAALLAWHTVKHGDRLHAIIAGPNKLTEFFAHRHQRNILPLLQILSDYTKITPPCYDSNHNSLEQALKHGIARIPAGSQVLLLGDFYQPDALQTLQGITRHTDIMAWHIADPLELAAPNISLLPLGNGTDSILLDIGSNGEAYKNFCAARQQKLIDTTRALSIRHHTVTATDNLPALLQLHLGRRR